MEAELSARKPEWRRRPSRAAADTAMPSADRANGMSIQWTADTASYFDSLDQGKHVERKKTEAL